MRTGVAGPQLSSTVSWHSRNYFVIPTHPDLNALLSDVLATAHRILKKQGHFYPFAAVVTPSGHVHQIEVEDDWPDIELPYPQEAIDILLQRLRGQAASGQIRAAATCIDANTLDQKNGGPKTIRVFLEHESGGSLQVDQLLRKRFWRGFEYEAPVSSSASGRIFASKQEGAS